ILTSVIFGLAHGILQQSIGACVVGIVIGYVAVKTGSLWPGVLYHFVHNCLSVLLGRISPDWLGSNAVLDLLFERSTQPGQIVYRLPATIIAGLLAGSILWWLKSLPYHHT